MAGAFKSFMGSAVHREGLAFVKMDLGFGKYAPKGVGRLLGPAFLAITAYQGYKEAGPWGAVRETGKSLATSYTFGAVTKALGIGGLGSAVGYAGIGIGLGIGAAVGADYAFRGITPFGGGSLFSLVARPAVAAHMRRHQEVEMGRPVIDQFGTLATMRQRSLAAIQSSKINGRSALSNEATLMYRPYFR